MKTHRGAIMIVCLVFLSVLMAMTLGFSSRIAGNNAGMEREIASARALELAQGACMWDLQQLWADCKAQALSKPDPRDRVVWLEITAQDQKYNPDWRSFGQGEIKATCKVFGDVPADLSYVDLDITATARVAPDSLARIDTPEEKQRWMYRAVQQIVRFNFARQKSRVFDFAYFVNNFGWCYDNGASNFQVYGNIGCNGDMEFRGKPIVDGNIFAARNPAIDATGAVKGEKNIYRDTVESYSASKLLPTRYDYNYSLSLPPDYDGRPLRDSDPSKQAIMDMQEPLDMPYLGDLSIYKEEAIKNNGKIEQLRKGGDPNNPKDWELVVDKVYGDSPNEAAIYSFSDSNGIRRYSLCTKDELRWHSIYPSKDGDVALIGTLEQPLRITGPVVITNDLVIKGTISGQGTIYTGRNLHIMGNLTYKDPPSWNVKVNDPKFQEQETRNASKDLVGFVAKGSIILGQYNRLWRGHMRLDYFNRHIGDSSDGWDDNLWNYFKTGFKNQKAQAYQADLSTDYYNPTTNRIFNGDYTANDGYHRYSGIPASPYIFNKWWMEGGSGMFYGTGMVPCSDTTIGYTRLTAAGLAISRKYYESSFSDGYIAACYSWYCSGKPSFIDGLFYTNHLFGGRAGNLVLRGSMVARDEGVICDKYKTFIYDPRASSWGPKGLLPSKSISAPAASAGYTVWLWQEIAGAR